MSILTTPQRLAEMLIDCNPSIVGAYYYTQGAIDQIERPCWLVFVEGARYPQTTVDQEQVEQSYSVAYIGQIYTSPEDSEFSLEYELLARQVAEDSVKYLLSHNQCQMTNDRGVFADAKSSLDSVTFIKIDARSSITLYQRDAVEGLAFWGFTIDLVITEQLQYTTVGS